MSFTVNGQATSIVVDPLVSLQTVLREELLLTGTKAGCRQGGCGSCSVLIDGELELSCLVTVAEVEGRDVETIEGLSAGETLHPIQTAFVENFALQCGFCTSGMVMATKALLDENAAPTKNEVIEALSGNICRCTGYEPIITAVMAAANQLVETNATAVGGAS
ncbi:MAG: (2Fe-2S)-binding protein [Acidimicrobiales bacterium]